MGGARHHSDGPRGTGTVTSSSPAPLPRPLCTDTKPPVLPLSPSPLPPLPRRAAAPARCPAPPSVVRPPVCVRYEFLRMRFPTVIFFRGLGIEYFRLQWLTSNGGKVRPGLCVPHARHNHRRRVQSPPAPLPHPLPHPPVAAAGSRDCDTDGMPRTSWRPGGGGGVGGVPPTTSRIGVLTPRSKDALPKPVHFPNSTAESSF